MSKISFLALAQIGWFRSGEASASGLGAAMARALRHRAIWHRASVPPPTRTDRPRPARVLGAPVVRTPLRCVWSADASGRLACRWERNELTPHDTAPRRGRPPPGRDASDARLRAA